MNPFASLIEQVTKPKGIQPGDVFERLTATDQTKIEKYKPMRLCDCSCGNQIWTREDQLKRGESKSCGCYRRDEALKRLALARTNRKAAKENGLS